MRMAIFLVSSGFHPRGGLVQKDQFRLTGQDDSHFDNSHVPMGDGLAGSVFLVFQTNKFQYLQALSYKSST